MLLIIGVLARINVAATSILYCASNRLQRTTICHVFFKSVGYLGSDLGLFGASKPMKSLLTPLSLLRVSVQGRQVSGSALFL